jgi:serine/threonine-protein kinase
MSTNALNSPRISRVNSAARGPIAPTLGDWAVLDTIQTGNHTRVAKAIPLRHDDECENEYAVKFVRPDTEQPRISAGLLSRELDLLNGLDHPHVVSVLDTGTEAGSPYFVMPFVGELTLADWIQRHQRISLVEALWAARQAAEGLNYLHGLGLCHLDVKPQNIVVGSSGHVTLVDLGFSQPIGHHPPSAPFVGSRDYVAPERFRHCRIVNPAADVYGLGMILRELLIGRDSNSHSERSTLDGQSLRHRREIRRRAIQSAHPGLPFEFIEFVERMVASIPERRPASDEVLDKLLRTEIEVFNP